MNKETSDKLLIKVAMKDKSITVLGDIAKMNKKAVAYAKNPALTVIGEAAKQDTANQNNAGISPVKPTVAQATNNALEAAGVQRGYIKPSYLDVLKQRAGDAWDWTKGKWNQLSPATQKSIGDIGLGVAGAMTGDALVRLLGGKKNRALRLLAMLGGAGLGIAGNQYLQNADFKNTVNSGFNKLVSKLKG